MLQARERIASLCEKNPPHTHVSFYSPLDTVQPSSAWFELTTNGTPYKPHAVNKDILDPCHMGRGKAAVIYAQTYCFLSVKEDNKSSWNKRDWKWFCTQQLTIQVLKLSFLLSGWWRSNFLIRSILYLNAKHIFQSIIYWNVLFYLTALLHQNIVKSAEE